MSQIRYGAVPALALLLAAIAIGPAWAASTATCQETKTLDVNGNPISDIEANKPAILAGLRSKGIKVSDIEDWGGCVRASVTKPDGTKETEFFDPNSLQQLTKN